MKTEQYYHFVVKKLQSIDLVDTLLNASEVRRKRTDCEELRRMWLRDHAPVLQPTLVSNQPNEEA